jgi:peptide/nickel transport system permease protein
MTLPGATAQLDEIELVSLAPRRREWLETSRAAWSLRRTKIGVALIVFVLAVAAFGPLVAPYTPTEFVGPSFQHPSAIAKLGTDYLGRDVLTRVLYGGRTAIALALAATAIGMFFGMLLGILAGYSSRLVDETIMRLLDVLLAFPSIIFALLIIAMVGPRPWLIAIAVGISHVPGVARVARGVTLEVAGHDFIKAAKALGVSKLTIMRSQILPNITTPMFVDFGIRFGYSVSAIAALSFLGFGLQPPMADWGRMINENRIGISIQPFGVLAPVLLIAMVTIGANLTADGLARTIIGIDRKAGVQ